MQFLAKNARALPHVSFPAPIACFQLAAERNATIIS
jgi:hypothetical protein